MLTRTPVAYEPSTPPGASTAPRDCSRRAWDHRDGGPGRADPGVASGHHPGPGSYPPARGRHDRGGLAGRAIRDPAGREGRKGLLYVRFWYWWDPALVLVETLYLARIFHPDVIPPSTWKKRPTRSSKVLRRRRRLLVALPDPGMRRWVRGRKPGSSSSSFPLAVPAGARLAVHRRYHIRRRHRRRSSGRSRPGLSGGPAGIPDIILRIRLPRLLLALLAGAALSSPGPPFSLVQEPARQRIHPGDLLRRRLRRGPVPVFLGKDSLPRSPRSCSRWAPVLAVLLVSAGPGPTPCPSS